MKFGQIDDLAIWKVADIYFTIFTSINRYFKGLIFLYLLTTLATATLPR